MRTVQHWVAGAETPLDSERTAPVYNPATGHRQAEVVLASRADVDVAVRAAADAFAGWSQTSISKRAKILFAFRELVHAHAHEIAGLITDEHGKVLSDALGEVQRGLEVVEFACGIPELLKGNYSDQVSTGVDMFSFREPLGVVAGITPFNFPAMVPMWMYPIAIACGNAFVLKPSERDPSASSRIAQLWRQAGLPDGVFNVVHGDKVAVDASGEAARRFQRGVHVGMIGVNVPIPVPMAFYSFGGWKDSLFGETHVHGPEGVRFYTRAKVITSRWPAPAQPSDASLEFPTAS